MTPGQWYLCYLDCDNMENINPIMHEEVLLEAKEEEGALEEAIILWKKRLKKGKSVCWADKEKYPRCPRLEYRIFPVQLSNIR